MIFVASWACQLYCYEKDATLEEETKSRKEQSSVTITIIIIYYYNKKRVFRGEQKRSAAARIMLHRDISCPKNERGFRLAQS